MKAKIEQINRYKITVNGKTFADFTKREEWNGMVKFTGSAGVLIVDKCQTSFEDVFESFFNVADSKEYEPVEMTVVKASPGLIA